MAGWLKNAFAVDPPGPATPDREQGEVVERLVTEIVRRRMATPALLFLESGHYMNFLGSQVMTFFAPFAHVLFTRSRYDALARFLEHRGSVEYICRRIEAHEDARRMGTALSRPAARDDSETAGGSGRSAAG